MSWLESHGTHRKCPQTQHRATNPWDRSSPLQVPSALGVIHHPLPSISPFAPSLNCSLIERGAPRRGAHSPAPGAGTRQLLCQGWWRASEQCSCLRRDRWAWEVQVRGRRLREFGDLQAEKSGGWLQALHCSLQAAVAGWAGKVWVAGDASGGLVCSKWWRHDREKKEHLKAVIRDPEIWLLASHEETENS